MLDCDSYKHSDQPISENFNEAQSSINRWNTCSNKAGVSWKRISNTVGRGRAAVENIFSQRSGPTLYSQIGVKSKTPLSAFCFLLMRPCFVQFKNVLSCMNKLMTKLFCGTLGIGKIYWSLNSTWCFTGKNTPIHQLWRKESGHPIFSKRINRNRCKELIKHLRFHNCSTCCKRRQTNKFCLLLETPNNFIENCKKCFMPSFHLTIEKQLFLCKTRCPFIQYMPNKPDKFGIKFWLLVKVSSKYFCNGKPYLGKDPTRNVKNYLPTDVCFWLMQPFLRKEYHVTIISLANKLKAEKTTLLETIRKQRKEVPKVEKMMTGKPLYLSEIYQSPSNATLTVYKAKKSKLIYMLSSMHLQFLLTDYTQKNYQKQSRVKSRCRCFGPNGALSYLQKCRKKVASGCTFLIL